MLTAYLRGLVPHAVMADWCEERDRVFPRTPLQPSNGRRRGRLRSTSGSARNHGARQTASHSSLVLSAGRLDARVSISGSRRTQVRRPTSPQEIIPRILAILAEPVDELAEQSARA